MSLLDRILGLPENWQVRLRNSAKLIFTSCFDRTFSISIAS